MARALVYIALLIPCLCSGKKLDCSEYSSPTTSTYLVRNYNAYLTSVPSPCPKLFRKMCFAMFLSKLIYISLLFVHMYALKYVR